MKSLKTIIILIGICLGFTSCDFLDKDPSQTTSGSYFQNESEATSFMTGVYSILQQGSFYGNDYLYLVGGDDTEHYGGVGRAPISRGLICNNANSSDAAVSAFWYTLYSGINRANIFLENIDNVPGMDETTRAQEKAEVRFLRAFYYFNLVQCWGDVPFTTSSTQTVGNLSIARTDKETIYDFIVKEMSEASDNLKSAKDLSYMPAHVSKSAAWGILARVYLFRAGEHFRDNVAANDTKVKEYFSKADEYAQKVMGEGHSLAPKYWDFFIDLCSNKANTTANESIWEAEFTGNYTTDVREEGRIGNVIGIAAPDLSSNASITGKADPGFCYCFIFCTPKLWDLYEANGDINRCNWNIAPFTYTQSVSGNGVDGRQFEKGKLAEVKNQYYNKSYSYGDTDASSKVGDREKTTDNADLARACGKYRREYEADKKSKNYTAVNFPILRYSDVLLMIAEAENEVNDAPTQLAYDCLNQVRSRAGISTLSGLTKETFRNAIKDERAMELCFEYTRRFDLIRWGEYVQDMNALVSRAQSGADWKLGPSNVYTYFQISSAYNYFPIPASEMAVNNQITKNNPGW